MHAVASSEIELAPLPEAVYRNMLDRLPTAAYACDAEGLITYYNTKAVETWGRAPKLRHADDRFCGSYRLFSSDGSPIAHEECWMALALRHRREYLAQEILIERPNASLLPVLAYATPLLDDHGDVVAGINMLVSIDERKRLERLMKDADEVKSLYMSTLAAELRRQLATMRDTVSALGSRAAGADHHAAARLQAQLGDMERLVEDLLELPSRNTQCEAAITR
jgi:signal transduction histidine kinase